MLRRICASVALCVLLAIAANQAAAASVNLQLYNWAGNYWVFASASTGDNSGIAGYGISVQNVSTLLHRAPRVASSTNGDGDGGSAGFSFFRSANNANPAGTGFYFGALQDTLTPTPYLIDGFGQTAGSFAAELPTGNTNVGITQPTWDARLLLAEGTYSGATPRLDLSNIDVFVNLFSPGGTRSVFKAQTLWTEIYDGPPNPIPNVGELSLVQTVTGEVISGNVPVTNVTTLTFDNISAPVYTPLLPGKPLVLNNLPTLNNAGAFSWNPSGALPGTYVWGLTGVNGVLSDGGAVSVVIYTPEPGTLALFGLAFAGVVGIARRRS